MTADSSSPSFEALRALVESGRLQMTFVLGLARGGTTALEKAVYEALPFDLQINEPSLLGPPPTDGSRTPRCEATFARVLAHVRAEGDGVTSVIVKEVTNKVLPEMVPLWAALSRCVIVVVRNPCLQMESRLKSMLDRVDSGALEDCGVSSSAQARTMRVHGEPVFLQEDTEETWLERYARMQRERDFSCLGPGSMRLTTIHPFCAWAEVQGVIWQKRSSVIALEDFSSLSEEQCRAILDWRLGWLPLRLQLTALPAARIVDFSSFQIDGGEALIAFVSNAMSFDLAKKQHKKKDFECCANGQDWSDEAWSKWYAGPCFTKVNRSSKVEAVTKRPLALEKFPSYMRATLKRECEYWANLLVFDSRALRPPRLAVRAPFVGLDPLHDTVCGGLMTEATCRDATLAALAALGGKEAPIMLLDLPVAVLVATAQSVVLAQCAFWYLYERLSRVKGSIEEAVSEELLLVSVVIPAHNEASTIEGTLRAVLDRRSRDNLEILVVDGGSTDGTLRVVEAFFAANKQDIEMRVVVLSETTRGGRGPAINAGVRAAKGEIIFVLHADTTPPDGFDDLLRLALADEKTSLCAFSFSIETTTNRRLSLRVFELFANLRSRFLELPFGDQGLGFRRVTLERGILKPGFADIPILEDLEIVLRCRRKSARIRTLPQHAVTSSRRFDRIGYANASFRNMIILAWWTLGATPRQIFECYYGRRSLRTFDPGSREQPTGTAH